MSTPAVLGSGINWAPLSNVTPFTYRDGETYLTQLKRLRDFVDDMVALLQSNIQIVDANDKAAIAALAAQFNDAISNINDLLQEIIASGNSAIFDPTKGVLDSTANVIGHVYDNTRYYAYFAEGLDSFEKTAAEWDDYEYSARHFDLALAYSPTQVQDENIVPPTVTPFVEA